MKAQKKMPAPSKATDTKAGSHKRRAYVVCSILAALLVIAVAAVLQNVTDMKSYNSYMDQARNSYYSSDFDGALTLLRKALAVDETSECLMLIADCYETQGNYEKALEALRMMDVQDPDVSSRISAIESRRQSLLQATKVTIAGKQFPSSATSLVLDNMGLDSSVFTEILQLYSIDSLSISGNAISDVSQIAQLGGLVTLNLSDNNISDISALASLGSLRTLYLDNNPIRDLSPLCSLPSLTSLSIKDIAISESQLETLSKALPSCAIHSETAQEESQDISFGGVTFKSDVTELDLSGMGLRDITALAGCQNLIKLNLSGNEISDLSPLMNMPNLTTLDLSDNALTDLRPLMGISSLSNINAAGNSITSTTPLCMMTGVRVLKLDGNPIRDFSGLRKLRSIEMLGLSSTGITDEALIYLQNLSTLNSLNLENNPALTGEGVDALQLILSTCEIAHSDLSYLVDMDGHAVKSDATALELSGTGIADISGITALSSLETVQLGMNSITNLYPLQFSPSRFTIRELDLSGNSIEDITPLSCLQVVETLNLSNNMISSELPLMNLKSLKTLYLGGNLLTQEQLINLQTALINCEIIMD